MGESGRLGHGGGMVLLTDTEILREVRTELSAQGHSYKPRLQKS